MMVKLLYPISLSFFIVALVSGLSYFLSLRIKVKGHTHIKDFIKSLVKQGQRKKVFVIDAFKYPLFLSTSFITLQLQLMSAQQTYQKDFSLIPISMIIYIILKALYPTSFRKTNRTYYSFTMSLDIFFFDLLIIMLVFTLGQNHYWEVRFIIFLLFLGYSFLRVSDTTMTPYNGNIYKKEEVMLDQAVWKLGEWIYTVSLLFFAINKILIQGISWDFGQASPLLIFHAQIILSIFLMVMVIAGATWVLQWSLKKKRLDQQVARVKYMLVPLLLLTLVVHLWRENGI